LNKITGGLITDLASGLIKGVLGINAGVVNINAASVVGGGGAPAGIPGFSQTAQGTGGLSGLIKGIPIIGAALAGAEFANIAAPIMADKLKEVTPQASGDIASGATKAVVGALTGPLGFPNLIGGIQDIAGSIGALIPLIDAKKNPQTVDISQGSIESLRGVIAAGLAPGKTPKQADAILAAGAQRDKETSAAIQTIVAQQATSNDIETLRGKIAAGLQTVDTSTHGTTIAATQAGFHAAQQTFATGLGIEGAIRANRPIINVDVQISATDITQVNVVEDRGGSRSGSRDGDGGGGPGQ
jgi:hypothetical protein